MSKESFAEAEQQVRRLLEEVGGSANAYEEPFGLSPAPTKTTPSPGKPSWEEVMQEVEGKRLPVAVSHLGDDNPFGYVSVPRPEPLPVEKVLTSLVSQEEMLETFEDLGLDPVSDDLGEVVGELLDETSNYCAGNVSVGEIRIPVPIDTTRYYREGIVENLGELAEVYRALTRAARGSASEVARLDSGEYPVVPRDHSWSINDIAKGVQYLWENSSNMYGGVVEEDDHFIWVIRTSDDHDLGYIHNGYVFLCRE